MTPLEPVAHGKIVGGVIHRALQALGIAEKKLPEEPSALPDPEDIDEAKGVVGDYRLDKVLRNGSEDAIDEEAGDSPDPNSRNIQAGDKSASPSTAPELLQQSHAGILQYMQCAAVSGSCPWYHQSQSFAVSALALSPGSGRTAASWHLAFQRQSLTIDF